MRSTRGVAVEQNRGGVPEMLGVSSSTGSWSGAVVELKHGGTSKTMVVSSSNASATMGGAVLE